MKRFTGKSQFDIFRKLIRVGTSCFYLARESLVVELEPHCAVVLRFCGWSHEGEIESCHMMTVHLFCQRRGGVDYYATNVVRNIVALVCVSDDVIDLLSYECFCQLFYEQHEQFRIVPE